MRGSVLISLFGMSMAIAGGLVACSGDEEKAASAPTGGEGESCTRRADCSSGFKCFENVCVKTASSSGGSGNEGGGGSGGKAGSGTGGTGGKGGSTTGGTGGKGGSTSGGTGGATGGTGPAPVLGGEGESCTRAADCEADLGCFNNRCAAEPAGEGGDGNVPVIGAGQGETCVLSTDCATGLICIPADTGGMGASVGVCSPADTGIAPTGKSCFAECTTPADCCELPTELHATLGAKSCTELDKLVADAGGCANPDTVSSPLCFAQDVYCDCASGTTTWQCTAGSCIYNGTCSTDGLVVDGCATVSRSGRALTATCDAGGTDRCRVPAGEAFCDTDADCDDQPVSDDGADTCIENECTCYNNAQCLRKCQEDLDCGYGKRCDSATDVCVPDNTCTPNDHVACQLRLGDYRATCVAGACTLPCDQDIDCNAGLTGGALSMVCDSGSCKPIGCTDHNECQNETDVANMVANPRKMFCATVPVGMAGVIGSSAITD